MVRRRQLGRALRIFRERAGLKVTDAAGLLLAAPSKISRLETGQRAATLRDVRDLCESYGVPQETRDQLMELAKESRQRAWWQESNLDPALATLIGMEGAAKSISEFEPLLVPGLLQTPNYARVVIDVYRHDDAKVKEDIFGARMRRQEILRRSPKPRLDVILDEAAIRRAVGGESVMREQLAHLVQATLDPDIRIQVVPFSSGMHIGTLNGFIILEFDQPIPAVPEADIAGIVYTETLMSGAYYDQPLEVEQHLKAFAELRRNALDPRSSIQLLRAAGSR